MGERMIACVELCASPVISLPAFYLDVETQGTSLAINYQSQNLNLSLCTTSNRMFALHS